MTRSGAALDGRGHRPATLAAVALLALLGGLAYLAMRPALEAEPPPPRAVTGTFAAPTASALIAELAPAPTQTQAWEVPTVPPAATATQPKNRATYQPPDMPYQFMGKTTTGGETSIVLFGRGRVVTLRGPGRLDDEYMVEAVFDEYLVLRHVPTGFGKFLQFAHRRARIDPPRDPEDSPRD